MRRHRLNQIEVAPVKHALENELRVLSDEASPRNLLNGTILFRVWWRLQNHRSSRPRYPTPITWAIIRAYINGTVNPMEIRA